MEKKKVCLVILDGWGLGNGSSADAIAHARTPAMDELCSRYPHATLLTSGEDVGLPEGQMGNSEVGHLNIGAGRVVYQDLVRIHKAIRDKSINNNPVLLDAFSYVRQHNKALHLMGLLSDGGIHSHIDHLKALCMMARENGCPRVYVHAFTDGRDTDPRSGKKFMEESGKFLAASGAQMATVVGRYYSMDRDKRWERIKLAYDMLVSGKGKKTTDLEKGIQESYDEGITDEFVKPIVRTDAAGQPVTTIKEGDAVICFNFRTDRCREITRVLTQQDMPGEGMKKLNLYYVTLTNYDDTFKDVRVVFAKDNLPDTLGEVLSRAGRSQLRIAETEKYPHVTFFFSGGRENPFEGEQRVMIPSPGVPTYDLQPEMSAPEVTRAVVEKINTDTPDFICLNFANPDMVGHTGVYKAIIKAVETVDACMNEVVKAGLEKGYSFIIIADHGNADYVRNADGSPNTAHTTNPVPCVLVDKDFLKIHSGRLCDIAPTILKMMNLPIPAEMNGKVLVE